LAVLARLGMAAVSSWRTMRLASAGFLDSVDVWPCLTDMTRLPATAAVSISRDAYTFGRPGWGRKLNAVPWPKKGLPVLCACSLAARATSGQS